MRKWTILFALVLPGFLASAQADDPMVLHENAKKFMQKGDYANATIILVRASQQAPYALAIAKDLALCYYMQNDNAKAISAVRPFIDKDNADEQTFQIAGMVYKRMGQPKDAEKIFKKAIKLFPASGPLYNDYGELLWAMKDYSAINLWEKGIKEEPSFPGNYYNAARHYFLSQDRIWSIIYGELFINLESHTARTAEMKDILVNSYKKLYSEPDLLSDTKGKNKFEISFLTSMNRFNDIVIRGLNVETLTMIRTRFILNWFYRHQENEFPLRLFAEQKYMLENGLFKAYNHWIFEASDNLNAFQVWTQTHSDEYEAFTNYMRDRNFTIPEGQYYH